MRVVGKTVAIALVAAATLASSAFAVDARSDYDDNVEFAALKTYRWVEGSSAAVAAVQQRIEAAVRAQLEARGLSEDAEAPDLWVVTHTATEGRARVDAQKYGYGYRWRSWGPTSVNFRDLEVGTLVVDLVDPATKELVWRGIASDTISPKAKKLEKSEKNIFKAAEKLFEDFPPQE